MKNVAIAALLAASGSAFAGGPDFSFTIPNQVVPSTGISVDLLGGGIPAGNYSFAEVSVDWSPAAGGPWSNEAIWAFTDAPFTPGVDDPALFTFYADPGSSPDGVGDGTPVTLTWQVPFDVNYNGGDSLWFNALQQFDDSSANWDNINVDLFFNAPPVPAYMPGAPAAVQPPVVTDLGVIANEGEIFTIDTFGSSFDTELGLYDQAGNLVANNDDAGGTLQSELSTDGSPVFAGLGAGEYFIALGEFNTIFNPNFDVSPGDAGGDYVGQANGVSFSGTLDGGTINWISFTVVPAPGAATLMGLAAVAGVRRRRA